jgi:hypothetical protein
MLRLVLLVLYLIGSSSNSPQTKQGSGWDPLGLGSPSPPQTETNGGGSLDPLGLNTPPPQTEPDAGSGWDPLG